MAVANPTAAGESNEVDLSAKLATREVASMKNTSHLEAPRPAGPVYRGGGGGAAGRACRCRAVRRGAGGTGRAYRCAPCGGYCAERDITIAQVAALAPVFDRPTTTSQPPVDPEASRLAGVHGVPPDGLAELVGCNDTGPVTKPL